MQHVEEGPLQPADKRYRFGYATLTTLTAVYKDEIDAFHHYHAKRNGDIQFTKEVE